MVGAGVGFDVGCGVGNGVGKRVGEEVGEGFGCFVGLWVGIDVGAGDGGDAVVCVPPPELLLDDVVPVVIAEAGRVDVVNVTLYVPPPELAFVEGGEVVELTDEVVGAEGDEPLFAGCPWLPLFFWPPGLPLPTAPVVARLSECPFLFAALLLRDNPTTTDNPAIMSIAAPKQRKTLRDRNGFLFCPSAPRECPNVDDTADTSVASTGVATTA